MYIPPATWIRVNPHHRGSHIAVQLTALSLLLFNEFIKKNLHIQWTTFKSTNLFLLFENVVDFLCEVQQPVKRIGWDCRKSRKNRHPCLDFSVTRFYVAEQNIYCAMRCRWVLGGLLDIPLSYWPTGKRNYAPTARYPYETFVAS